MLAGIVEDSRNTSFCGMIKRDILSMVTHRMAPELAGLLEKTRDTNLLYLAMERGERTRVFPYSESPEEHPVLRDLGDYARDLKSFYLKTAEHDRPIKVDMLHGNEDILSSVLLSISGHHSGYGLPAPIIEADNVTGISSPALVIMDMLVGLSLPSGPYWSLRILRMFSLATSML